MSFVATAIIGSGVIGAGASLFASNQQQKALGNAANTQLTGQLQAIQAEQGFVNQGIGAEQNFVNQGTGAITDFANKGVSAQLGLTGQGASSLMDLIKRATGTLQPFTNAGNTALNSLMSLITPGGGGAAALAQTPGFQFTRDWGMRGINNAASTSGLGGNVLKAGADYSGGLASTIWQNVVQALQSAAGLGAGAAGQAAGALSSGGLSLGSLYGSTGSSIASLLSGAGSGIGNLLGGAGSAISGLLGGAGQNISGNYSSTANNLSNLAVGQGNAQAGGITGAANSLTGPLNTFTNLGIMKSLLGGGGGPAFNPGGAWSGVGNPATAGAFY